jgi:hypothetical protein
LYASRLPGVYTLRLFYPSGQVEYDNWILSKPGFHDRFEFFDNIIEFDKEPGADLSTLQTIVLFLSPTWIIVDLPDEKCTDILRLADVFADSNGMLLISLNFLNANNFSQILFANRRQPSEFACSV